MNATATHSDSLTIRAATPGDERKLIRLAQLDSATYRRTGAALLAELDGELVAALPLGEGDPIADPFRRTAAIVALLESRARELVSFETRAPRTRRLLTPWRMLPAARG